MAVKKGPRQNHLLVLLPDEDYQRLAPHLERVELKLGDSLAESGQTSGYVYFPIDCIISLLSVMEDGSSSEISMIGVEGMLGISQFMGGGSTPSRAVMQSAGSAYRLKGQVLKNEFSRAGPLHDALLLYTQALITQMAQTVACNRHCRLDQHLCRWLLLSHDRLPTDELIMTQELIANMLGVRRESVSETAGQLQHAGLISYRRGRINILDRAGLESRVCECYGTVKREYDRLFNFPAAS